MSHDREPGADAVAATVCADCGSKDAPYRVDFHLKTALAICDACSDRRAVQCPFCGNPFGREVKRASKCKKCGETVARNRRVPVLSSQLASPAICEALDECAMPNAPTAEAAWIRSCLLSSLLQAVQIGGASKAVDSAFAAALRARFEKGLTRERLNSLGHGFARAVWLCGGNPRAIQRTLHRLQLETLRASCPTATVEILPAGDPCEKCAALTGRAWTIAEALAENPIPCRDCLDTNESGYGWCRCEYQHRLEAHLAGLVCEIGESGEIEAEARRIMLEWEQANQPSHGSVPLSSGGSIPVEQAAKIASNGWHYVRNRGKRGLHDGCNGALEALREIGVSTTTTPNRERPVFNDIVLVLSDGERCVLMFSTAAWEYVVRAD